MVPVMRVSLLIALTTLRCFAEGTFYYYYTCPLPSSASVLSSDSNPSCSNSGSSGMTNHSYLQIGSTCYDWGTWNYPRHLKCNDPELACCVNTRTLYYKGLTTCAHIDDILRDFETAWRSTGARCSLTGDAGLTCQFYHMQMTNVLTQCDASVAFG